MQLETLNQLLERAARFPETGIRFLDRRERPRWASWAEIDSGARSVGGSLRELGVAGGERVALTYPTGIDFFHAFFGILLAGAVPVPIYPPVRLGRLDEYHHQTANMMKAVDACLVLSDPAVKRLLGRTIALAQPALGCCTLAELPQGPGGWGTPVAVESSSLALIQFSSGTTVDPKPVALSHRAVLAQIRTLNRFWHHDPNAPPTCVSWLPLYHDMGLIGCVLGILELPSVLTLIAPETFVSRPASWLRALSRYRGTISAAPNFAYGLCAKKVRDEELEGVDLSRWRVAINGAEAIAAGVLRAFQRRFASYGLRPQALTPVYGLSEAGLAVTFSAIDLPFHSECFDRDRLASQDVAKPDPQGQEIVSVGRPIPGSELDVVDRHGRAKRSGEVGRIQVCGPSLMEGYWNRPDATKRVLRHGRLDTGDLGFLHEGELYLVGRAKELVIRRGRNYMPSDLEAAAGEVKGVRKGCVVAVSWMPDEAECERVLIFLERERHSPKDKESRDTLRRSCAESILTTTGLQPDEILVLEPGTLPRTSSGKLRRYETLRRHLLGTLEKPKRVSPLFITGAMARSALAFTGLKYRKRGKE